MPYLQLNSQSWSSTTEKYQTWSEERGVYLLWQQYMAVMSISVMTSNAITTPRVTPARHRQTHHNIMLCNTYSLQHYYYYYYYYYRCC